MTFDLGTVLLAALYGLIGSIAYLFINRILEQKLYLSAAEHLVSGVIVGVLAIFVLGYAVPVNLLTATPIIVLGYFSLDVLDSLVQKYAGGPSPAPVPAAKP